MAARQKRWIVHPTPTAQDELLHFCRHDAGVKEIQYTLQARTGHQCIDVTTSPHGAVIRVVFSREHEHQFLTYSVDARQWHANPERARQAFKDIHREWLCKFLLRLSATTILSEYERAIHRVFNAYYCAVTPTHVYWVIELRPLVQTYPPNQHRTITGDYNYRYIQDQSRTTIIPGIEMDLYGLPPLSSTGPISF